jgi:hypothetical protein
MRIVSALLSALFVAAVSANDLFRKEQGEWRLIHRHADPILAKTAPPATLQR